MHMMRAVLSTACSHVAWGRNLLSSFEPESCFAGEPIHSWDKSKSCERTVRYISRKWKAVVVVVVVVVVDALLLALLTLLLTGSLCIMIVTAILLVTELPTVKWMPREHHQLYNSFFFEDSLS